MSTAPDTGKRPPGPAGLPLLGSLLEAYRDPLAFEMDLVRRYGDVVRYRVGFYEGYLVTHPDGVRRVLERNHANYNKQNYNFEALRLVLGDGLITSDGAQWRRHRQLLQPAFRHEQVARFGSTITGAIDDLLARWKDRARAEEPVDITAEMMRLTVRVVAEALFGTDIGPRIEVVARAFSTINAHVARRFRKVFVSPLWVPTRANRSFEQARADLDAVVYEIIDARRRKRSFGDDLLGRLLAARGDTPGAGLTDHEIRDEVMTLLLAGHETTAALLAWTWYLIGSHPQVERRLRDELDDVLGGRRPTLEQLQALPYLERVVMESLRLYPPVWITSRKAVDDDAFGGYVVPAGSTVTVSPYATHRRSDLWREPESFDPDRFTVARCAARPRYAYFPFGGGPRHCIGHHLAMSEARLVLATVAQQFRLVPVSDRPLEPEPLITLRPRPGLQMMLHPVR